MAHRITLERNTLRFSAAHFTTFGDECEPLHGHNYDLFVEIEGALTKDSWVFDFSEAKRIVATICKQLDHRFLLPLGSAVLQVEERQAEYEVTFGDRRYVMPKGDVVALPSTTPRPSDSRSGLRARSRTGFTPWGRRTFSG